MESVTWLAVAVAFICGMWVGAFIFLLGSRSK